MNALDCDFVRAQFPFLCDPAAGRWAFLENAGGSQIPHQVSGKLNHFFSHTKIQPGGPSQPALRAARPG